MSLVAIILTCLMIFIIRFILVVLEDGMTNRNNQVDLERRARQQRDNEKHDYFVIDMTYQQSLRDMKMRDDYIDNPAEQWSRDKYPREEVYF